MAHVTITVHGRPYTVACDDGEEEHLTALAIGLDERVSELAKSVGPVGDARLFLMASLVLADEVSDRSDQINLLEAQLDKARAGDPWVQSRVAQAETSVAQVLEAATRRIEDMARRFG